MILRRNHRHGSLIQRVNSTDSITMVDHKSKDHGRRTGSTSTVYSNEISAMENLDKHTYSKQDHSEFLNIL